MVGIELAITPSKTIYLNFKRHAQKNRCLEKPFEKENILQYHYFWIGSWDDLLFPDFLAARQDNPFHTIQVEQMKDFYLRTDADRRLAKQEAFRSKRQEENINTLKNSV
nr:hypothetical protein [Cytophagales bacterium]